MAISPSCGARDPGADPFNERSAGHLGVCRQILGGSFRFDSNSRALLELVEIAFGGLPEHLLPVAAPEFRISLRLSPRRTPATTGGPAAARMQSGADMICGVMDADNYVVINPGQRQALVAASEDMLGYAYHLRYELLEFAVFVLASRALGLVPLHGACVGQNGRGVLLLGASGSGKSTLAMFSLLQGLEFLAEDAVFVEPRSLLATGISNFLHVQGDSLKFVDDQAAHRWISEAPRICRRSGVHKFEADLRRGRGVLAANPLELTGAVFVSGEIASNPGRLLSQVATDSLAARLCADQPYAAGQPGWALFVERLAQVGVYELRRGEHPRESVDALQCILRRVVA